MYKQILNYLGRLISLPTSINFTYTSRSGTKASVWTPFTDNAKCTALKLNLKSCTNILPPCAPANSRKKVLSVLADQPVIRDNVKSQVIRC